MPAVPSFLRTSSDRRFKKTPHPSRQVVTPSPLGEGFDLLGRTALSRAKDALREDADTTKRVSARPAHFALPAWGRLLEFIRIGLPSASYNRAMADPPESTRRAPSPNSGLGVPAGTRGQRWFELCLVSLVAFSGPFWGAVYIFENPSNPWFPASNARFLVGILHEIIALSLLAYVLSRRSLRFRDLGFRWSLRDTGIGLLIAAIAWVAYDLGYFAVQLTHYRIFGVWAPAPSPRSLVLPHHSVAAIPYFLLSPFFEEMIVRAYLMTEIASLTGSSTIAIVISVGVQFSYHLYQGWTQALSISFMFLVFAIYYALRRRALPIIVSHGLFDIWSLTRLW